MLQPELPAGLVELLGGYLARQRWYAGQGSPGPGDVRVVAARELGATEEGAHRLHWAVVEAEGERYQVLIGERGADEAVEAQRGDDRGRVGTADGVVWYDAIADPELCLRLLEVVSAGTQTAERVRPISVEQSNTSLVYDDRIILKVYRRLAGGPNPDVEVTDALFKVGFDHVAPPYATWREEGFDLAFAQGFLAGGTDGWALAQTSLRDFYNQDHGRPGADDPSTAGGDFAGEASRIGRVTAELHVAMRTVWGTDARRLAGGDWELLVDRIEAGLADAAVDTPGTEETETGEKRTAAGAALIRRFRAVSDPGPAQRLHGDYHLGQVMRTDAGWYVLDFEGEPARPVEERLLPASPLKDVAGMLRSFDYAARFALGDRAAATPQALSRAEAWERHNRVAFVAGYFSMPGADALVPPEPSRHLVLAAYELDKALYELAYERAYRPTWVSIPAGAIDRILSRPE